MAVFAFDDLLEAQQWALDTQKGRRNLDKWELGKIALKLKPEIEARAKANMSAGGGDQKSDEAKSGSVNSPNPISPVDRDRAVQCEAGWYDWFCRDEALAGRLKKLSGVVLGITDPFILDNYYVWFKNNCPVYGPLYDDVRFEPLSGERDGKYFVISLDSPHEQMKWALFTERYGYDAPEFECGNVRDMVKYVNAIAPELAQGIQPPFVKEKEAVGAYVRQHEGKDAYCVRREGAHRFTYLSSCDWKYRPVAVSTTLEGYPRGL